MSVRNNIIKGLIDHLESVKDNSSYPIAIKKVFSFDENYLNFGNHEVPALMVNDTGLQSVVARNGQDYKYGLDFYIIGFCHGNSPDDLRTQLNGVHSFIMQYIDATSGSDIHVNAQSLEYEGTENMYAQSNDEPSQIMGVVAVSVSMRYYISGGAF